MADIKIGKIQLGMAQTNCYFVYREGENDAIVFDPADAGDYIYEGLAGKNLNVKAIMLTHGHFDHIFGVKELKAKAGCKVYACEEEAELLSDPELNVSGQVGRPTILTPDILLKDGEEIEICNIKMTVIHTPGHTQGSCCFYIPEAGFLIAGDTLFCESIGRTDLPTGRGRKLINSITEKLLILPDKTKVYPGHGGSTTIENERENNPFLI